MSNRTIIVILLALVCGGAAAVGVRQLRRQQSAPNIDTVPVVVANVDVPRGNVLGSDELAVEQWPKGFAPQGVLTEIEAATERTATVRLVKGEPILQAKLAPKDAGRGLASMVPRGMRALTIQASHISAGVGGFLLPGNYVDILLTTTSNTQDGSGGAATTTLLQNVQILAVAQHLDAPDSNKVDPKALRDVTVLVTPNQANMLDLGMNKGVLHLALRNPEDRQESDARPATLSQLRFHQEEVTPSPLTGEFLTKTFTNIASALAAARLQPAEPVPSEPKPEAEPKQAESEVSKEATVRREARIRTLRGVTRGSVRVEIANTASATDLATVVK